MIDAQEFERRARAFGADDVRFVRADAFLRWKADAPKALSGVRSGGMTDDPRSLMGEAKSIAVLFFNAAPFCAKDSPYPRYYLASHKGHLATRAFIKWLTDCGVRAKVGTGLPHRAAALRSGGVQLENGLYAHPVFGSYTHVELVLNDAVAPAADGEVNACAKCGACARACPTGALGGDGRKMALCLRNHLFTKDMPEAMRDHAQTLLGCERCQRVCPINAGVAAVPIADEQRGAAGLGRLLAGDVAPLAGFVGKNLARKQAMAAQAALIVGARRLTQYGVQLNELLRTGQDVAYLDWALSRVR
jgi:ferredoxin